MDVEPDDKRHDRPSRLVQPRPGRVRNSEPQRGKDVCAEDAVWDQEWFCAAVLQGVVEGGVVSCAYYLVDTGHGRLRIISEVHGWFEYRALAHGLYLYGCQRKN